MSATNAKRNWPTLLLLVALVGMFAYQSLANRMVVLNPAVIATVDVEVLFNKLDENAASQARIKSMLDDLQEQVVQRRDEIEMLREDINVLPPGTKQYEEATQKLARLSFELQAFLELVKAKQNIASSREMKHLYTNIRAAIATMATRNGYDLVLMDDTKVDMPLDATEEEMAKQISARRVLYAAPTIDITDDLIAQMNADFAAQG